VSQLCVHASSARRSSSWTISSRCSSVNVALFVNNVLDSQPTVQRRNICCSDTLVLCDDLQAADSGCDSYLAVLTAGA
jgi:hypothetical protein